jgi:hypothetical protein
MIDKFDIFNLPLRLFKYYGYDIKLNAKRLAGEVYLACPYDFNDPCDCQREVINNANDRVKIKGKDWLIQKMKELDYNEEECRDISESLLNDDSKVNDVRKKMLERLGILCLTQTQSDSLMWGYYASNEGICLEYDTNRIVSNLVIGYINKMSYTTTRFLYSDDEYKMSPAERNKSLNPDILKKVEDIIKKTDIKRISNRFLEEQKDKSSILHFARNILLKRIYARSIIYNVAPNESPSPLFFNRGDKTSEAKYFKKTKTWSHEKEFRFIVSLGGRLPINIGKECIKNIYLGCNISNERIAAVVYLMTQNNLTAGLYKMKRLKNGGLRPQKIDWETYKTSFNSFASDLVKNFPNN